jgi:3-phenylpropionate/trans-cinnamate dioxygenase ferredoxin subunit
MSDWIDVVAETALADGEHVLLDVYGARVAVFKQAGEYFAIEDVCSHDGTEIASGVIDGTEIVCPRHGARFCLKTGRVQCGPAYEDIASYAVQVLDGRIVVKAKP